jgi:hypothetical protein
VFHCGRSGVRPGFGPGLRAVALISTAIWPGSRRRT